MILKIKERMSQGIGKSQVQVVALLITYTCFQKGQMIPTVEIFLKNCLKKFTNRSEISYKFSER